MLNHTDRHLSFSGRSTGTAPLTHQQRADALGSAELTIESVTGVKAKPWFRPPYGDRDASVDRDAAGLGYRYELMWTVDTLGWKGVAPADLVRRTMASASAGAVVLMHVGAASTDWQVRVWCKTAAYFDVWEATIHSVKTSLIQARIPGPTPALNVTVAGDLKR